MIIIGQNEIENRKISVRDRDTDKTTEYGVDEFVALIKEQIASRA